MKLEIPAILLREEDTFDYIETYDWCGRKDIQAQQTGSGCQFLHIRNYQGKTLLWFIRPGCQSEYVEVSPNLQIEKVYTANQS